MYLARIDNTKNAKRFEKMQKAKNPVAPPQKVGKVDNGHVGDGIYVLIKKELAPPLFPTPKIRFK
jgi:hypothetical protein